jgi:hypothetical protein
MDDSTQCEPTSAVDVPTQAAAIAELAWSNEQLAIEPESPSWRAAWTRAVLIVLCAVAAAASLYLAWPHTRHAPASRPTTSAPAPPIVAPPAPTATALPPPPAETAPPSAPPPPVEADPLTPNDHRFITQLNRDGLGNRNPGTEGSAVATAMAICRAFNQGDTYAHIHGVMSAQYLTSDQAQAYIQDAVMFYCPRATY